MTNYLQIGVQEGENCEGSTVKMTFVLYLCTLLLPWATAQLSYLPPSYRNTFPHNALQHSPQMKHTDFYTYSAPNDFETYATTPTDELLRPRQQVVFIRAPETNVFTLTADQLARSNALNIYVLSRQTNVASLAEQLRDIQPRRGQQPVVHFVNYRTPQDVTRALATIKGVYQQQVPGSTIDHRETTAQLIDFGGGHVRATEVLSSPVIFKILPRHAAEYEAQAEAARVESLFRQYLPVDAL